MTMIWPWAAATPLGAASSGIGLLLQRPGGHGNPLQDSGLESPMDRGAWRATVCRAAESWTRQRRLNRHLQGPVWPHVACLMASLQLIYCFGTLDTKQEAAGFCCWWFADFKKVIEPYFFQQMFKYTLIICKGQVSRKKSLKTILL